jgi:uncharacterized C2H2 Zn-finger protein
MEDPVMYQNIEQFACPQCGALFADEMALSAHREEEHVEEAQGTDGRPDHAQREQLEEGGTSASPHEHSRESPRPTEPAP